MKISTIAVLTLALVAASAVPASAKGRHHKQSYSSNSSRSSGHSRAYGQNDGKYNFHSNQDIAKFWRDQTMHGP